MDRKAAKELLHIRGWLERVAQIVHRGLDAYLADDLLQEAGDSFHRKKPPTGLPDILGADSSTDRFCRGATHGPGTVGGSRALHAASGRPRSGGVGWRDG